MQKMEPGVLVKNKPNQYRWNGIMEAEERDDAGDLLYRFSPTADGSNHHVKMLVMG